MFFSSMKKSFCIGLTALFAVAMIGCGGSKQEMTTQAVAVKTMQIIKRDTSIVNEYAGQIQGKNEVPVLARVSGHVVEKYIKGGQMVKQGEPLFKIDNRPYLSAALNAQAQLAQSQATLANTQVDTKRYRELYKESAISEQMLTTQEALESQQAALVNAQGALARKAQDDLNDTVVRSPIDGRLYVDDVSIGLYAQAGGTKLVTVGVIDPVFAQFNLSENEYLEMRRYNIGKIENSGWGEEVSITLSDGSLYPFKGKVTQIDRGMGDNSGTLTIKASFANPDGVLLPGMFSRVRIEGTQIKGALLIPQRSVQQVLEKSYVMVLAEDNKVKAKPVVLGRKIGSFWIVEKGLEGDENIVVEGLTKVQEGVLVEPTMVQAEDLGLTFE